MSTEDPRVAGHSEQSQHPAMFAGNQAKAPAPKVREKVKLGKEQVDVVKKLASDLAKPAGELGFVVGQPTTFGLKLDVHDPETGLLVSAARAARRDVGVAGHVMSVDDVVSTITSARTHAATAGLVRYVDQEPKPPDTTAVTFTVDERHPNVISVREGGATTYFWVADGQWFHGHSFDSGVNGPFGSYEHAVEHWRKELSRARGAKKEV